MMHLACVIPRFIRFPRTGVNMEKVYALRANCGMVKKATETVTARLKALRERAGLTMAEVAAALGYKTASGYQRYEDADVYRKKYISIEMAEKLVPLLSGRGNPPITAAEVMALAGTPVPTPESVERLLAGYSPRRRAIALAGIQALLQSLDASWNDEE
jgi:transcriptional regulator with XRE-family HTH domain